MRIIPQGDSAWFCADKSAGGGWVKSEGGLCWSEGEVGDVWCEGVCGC